ncbi:hypothetical protein BC832DRAFT_594175 [Gaertneriomyces semiglobifer]|nr:hypothetical protein BC832DRAFT_594175 [Gaertneriomyces semiglobifer]
MPLPRHCKRWINLAVPTQTRLLFCSLARSSLLAATCRKANFAGDDLSRPERCDGTLGPFDNEPNAYSDIVQDREGCTPQEPTMLDNQRREQAIAGSASSLGGNPDRRSGDLYYPASASRPHATTSPKWNAPTAASVVLPVHDAETMSAVPIPTYMEQQPNPTGVGCGMRGAQRQADLLGHTSSSMEAGAVELECSDVEPQDQEESIAGAEVWSMSANIFHNSSEQCDESIPGADIWQASADGRVPDDISRIARTLSDSLELNRELPDSRCTASSTKQ